MASSQNQLWSMKVWRMFGSVLFCTFCVVTVWQNVVWTLTWPLNWLNCSFSVLSWSKFCVNCQTKHMTLQLHTYWLWLWAVEQTLNHCSGDRAIGAGQPLSLALLWAIVKHPGNEPGQRQKTEAEKLIFVQTEIWASCGHKNRNCHLRCNAKEMKKLPPFFGPEWISGYRNDNEISYFPRSSQDLSLSSGIW
jgi:hypothetical protein